MRGMVFSGGRLGFHSVLFCVGGARKRLPVCFVRLRVGGVDTRQSFEDVGGDEFGVLGIKPIMRIAAAMRVTIAGSNGDAPHLERCDSERSVDIAGAASLDIARGGRLEQAVEPEGA